jgi:hypothetical protein
MQECAVGGTIVVVNVTEFRSDAITVSSTNMKTLNLPKSLAVDAKGWLNKDWREGRRSERAEKNKEYSRYLSWLWRVCVRQVVKEVYGVRDISAAVFYITG